MADLKPLNLVINGTKTVLDSFDAIEKAYKDTLNGIAKNPLKTDVDKSNFNELVNTLSVLESKAASVGRSFKDNSVVVEASAKSLQDAYNKAFISMQSNELKTPLDNKYLGDSIAVMQKVESEAAKMGIELNKNALGIQENYEMINGELYKISKNINSVTGTVESSYSKIANAQTIGNAKVQFDSLGNSVSQLARELPAFANSAQTGFMAISNNLPTFFDAMAQARQQTGSMGGALASLGKSFVSPMMALNLFVLGLTVFGPKIVKFFTKPSAEAAKKAAELKAAFEGMSKVFDGIGKKAGKLNGELSLLFATVRASGNSINVKNEALKDINTNYDQYLKNLGIETVTIENQAVAYQKLEEYVYKVAIAKAATEAFSELYGEIVKSTITTQGLIEQISDVRTSIEDMFSDSGKKNIQELIDKGYSLADAYLFAKNIAGALNENVSPKDVTQRVREHASLLGSIGEQYGKAVIEAEALRLKEEAVKKGFDKIFSAGANSPLFSRLNDLTKWIEKFTGMAYGDGKSKGSGGSGRKFSDQFVLGKDIFETISKFERDVNKSNVSISSLEQGIIDAERQYKEFKSRVGNVADAQKLIDENNKIKEELRLLGEREAEAAKNHAESLNFYASNLQTTFNKILNGSAAFNGKWTQQQRDFATKLAQEVQSGTKTIEDAAKEMALSGLFSGKETKDYIAAYKKFSDEQLAIDKERSAKTKRQTEIDIELQKAKSTSAAKDLLKIEESLNEMREQLAKRKDEDLRNALARAQQDAIDAGEDGSKYALGNYNDFLRIIELKRQQGFDNIMKESKDFYDEMDKLNEDLVKSGLEAVYTLDKTTGEVIVNQSALGRALLVNDQDLLAKLQGTQNSYDAYKLKFASVNAEYYERLANAASTYAKQVGVATESMMQQDLDLIRKGNERIKKDLDDNYNERLNIFSKYVEDRRGKGEKQSQEERASINRFMQEEIDLVNYYYDKLLDAETKLLDAQISGIRLRNKETKDPKQKEALEKQIDALSAERDRIIRQIAIERQNAIDQVENDSDALIDNAKETANQMEEIIRKTQEFGNLLIDVWNQQHQNFIDTLKDDLNDIENRQSDVLNNISRLEDDLEGKRSGRREAVLQALEQQREIEEDLGRKKIELANKIADEERKLQKRNQAVAISNAIINGALAQTNIWATVPKADFGVSTYVLSGISAGITAAQIALIASQKFAKGGFTGSGWQRDETGHKVAGVVHNDEWVAPKWMVESPKFGSIIGSLESARKRGFADGGFTSPDLVELSNSVNSNSSRKLESMIEGYMQASIQLSNRPIYTKATEVQTVAEKNNSRRKASTI